MKEPEAESWEGGKVASLRGEKIAEEVVDQTQKKHTDWSGRK